MFLDKLRGNCPVVKHYKQTHFIEVPYNILIYIVL